MKTNNYTVEPSLKKYELQSFIENDKSKIENEELVFMIKNEGEILGFAKYLSIKESGKCTGAILLHQLICADNFAAKELLKESIMHAWEIGYHAVFSTINNTVLEQIGFKKFKSDTCSLPFNQPEIYGISLSWKGLSLYKKSENSIVN